MSVNEFAQQILQVQQRVDALLRRANQAPTQPDRFASEILPALRAAEEALQGAETVLQRQDQELHAVRQALTSE